MIRKIQRNLQLYNMIMDMTLLQIKILNNKTFKKILLKIEVSLRRSEIYLPEMVVVGSRLKSMSSLVPGIWLDFPHEAWFPFG